jgi:hypothetical protein
MTSARLSLLALALLLLAGCSSQRFLVPPGAQVAKLGSVGLRVEVTELINAKRKLSVMVQVENQGEQELRFKKAGVSLDIGGRRYEARDIRAYEIDVDIAPGQVKSKAWGFHVGRVLEPGTYEITIRDVDTLAGGDRTSTGLDLVVPVTIPGDD